MLRFFLIALLLVATLVLLVLREQREDVAKIESVELSESENTPEPLESSKEISTSVKSSTETKLEIVGEARDPDAESLIAGMLARVKESGRAAVMIEYVDWESALARATKSDLDRISQPPTAEGLRNYIETILSDPSGYLAQQFELRARRLPPAQAEKLRETAKQFNESLAGVEELIKNRLLNTSYTVKGSRIIDATAAQVYLEIKFGEDRKLTTLDLVRREGNWRLATIEFLKAEGGRI
jgi:hypothetical protein